MASHHRIMVTLVEEAPWLTEGSTSRRLFLDRIAVVSPQWENGLRLTIFPHLNPSHFCPFQPHNTWGLTATSHVACPALKRRDPTGPWKGLFLSIHGTLIILAWTRHQLFPLLQVREPHLPFWHMYRSSFLDSLPPHHSHCHPHQFLDHTGSPHHHIPCHLPHT
jgi:hypothetical protein